MRSKAVWEPEYHRVFLDLCMEQIMVGNKPGTHFSKEGWRNILKSFQETTGVMYDRMQLKNHWDTMSRQWKIWCRLIQTSYMNWDPDSYTFGASDEEWAYYLQENPDAGQYRVSIPQDLEKLEILFAGSDVDVKDVEVVRKRRRRSEEIEEDEESNRSLCSSANSQTKGYWSPSTHELFLDLLVQETFKGNRPDTHFNKEGWKTIHETINEKTGIGYTRAQLKNHWDCTRKSWKIWCQLVGEDSMKWDQETRSFGATEEEWRIYLRDNPRAGQFRHKEVPHADKLSIIFNGVIEPGEAYTPPKHMKVLKARSESPQLEEEEAQWIERVPPPQSLDVKRLMRDGMLHESPVCVEIESAKRMYCIGECIESLDAMKEVEQGSDLYLFALDQFLRREYREIFLELKKPSLRIAWLQRLQSTAT